MIKMSCVCTCAQFCVRTTEGPLSWHALKELLWSPSVRTNTMYLTLGWVVYCQGKKEKVALHFAFQPPERGTVIRCFLPASKALHLCAYGVLAVSSLWVCRELLCVSMHNFVFFVSVLQNSSEPIFSATWWCIYLPVVVMGLRHHSWTNK